ncbi:MAG: YggS family pyridoxal phosphate-dependent enzyme [Candidatus Acidiferrales bacterium]
MYDLAGLAKNLEDIRERVAAAAARCGRRADEITLVAVTKTFPAEAIRAAYELGVRHFGENRVQEFESKERGLDCPEATWHLIGHLQGNKARRAAQLFHRIDSVDSVALAQKLDRLMNEVPDAAEEPPVPTLTPTPGNANRRDVLIEVRLSDEATKSGVAEAELPAVVAAIAGLSSLRLRGWMTIPPFFENPEDARPYFRRMRALRDDLWKGLREGREKASAGPGVLSMGMSHDFEVAIEEGATEIRVGTALFGKRPPI